MRYIALIREILSYEKLRRSSGRQFLTGLLVVGVVLGTIAIVKSIQISSATAAQSANGVPPVAVTSIVVQPADWSEELTMMGSLTPSQGATLSAEEPGKISQIAVESGAYVNAGDLLIEVDAGVENAKLEGAMAASTRALSAFERAKRLRAEKAISEDNYEAAVESLARARAEEESLRAVVARKRITAPFSGILGIRKVNLGEYVAAGTELIPLHALDPIYLDFSVPQSVLSKLKLGASVSFSVDAYPQRAFQGEISAINPQIDQQTRNVAARATVQNQDGSLRPGMFVTLKLLFAAAEKVIAIPQSAVLYAPYGDSVYVIRQGETGPRAVAQQIVKLGGKLGDRVAVIEGLKSGDEIVTSGAFKLRPDSMVIVNNTHPPKNELNPSPADS